MLADEGPALKIGCRFWCGGHFGFQTDLCASPAPMVAARALTKPFEYYVNRHTCDYVSALSDVNRLATLIMVLPGIF